MALVLLVDIWPEAIDMARRIEIPFSENGDYEEVPMDAQLDDTVSYDEGYTFDYQRPAGSSVLAKEVGRRKFNGVLRDITGNIKDYQDNGAPEWFTGVEYARGARVKHSDEYWTCSIVSGTTTQEPGTGSDWADTTIPARAVQNNLSATVPPDADNDSTEGYEPLSLWLDTVAEEVYTCISATPGLAIWALGTLTADQLGSAAFLNASTVGAALIQQTTPAEARYNRINSDGSVTQLTLQQLKDTVRETGEVKLWSTASAPSGWLICDGSAVSRTTYSALFTLIGTTYGAGDGSTTFNLPDFRGRNPIGVDGSNALASTGGSDTVTLAVGDLPAHSHDMVVEGVAADIVGPPITGVNVPDSTYKYLGAGAASGQQSAAMWRDGMPNPFTLDATTIGNTGAGNAITTRDKFLTINFIIAT